jgi:outer membrane lipopolysaccharide assembly protein LptE/RlpB
MNRATQALTRIAIITLALLVSACGFHLQGTEPSGNNTFQIVKISGKLPESLRYALLDNRSSHGHKLDLVVLDYHYDKRRLTQSTSGFSDEYLLVMELSFSIQAEESDLSAPFRAQVETVFQDNQQLATGKSNELEQLKQWLEQQLAQQTLNHISLQLPLILSSSSDLPESNSHEAKP